MQNVPEAGQLQRKRLRAACSVVWITLLGVCQPDHPRKNHQRSNHQREGKAMKTRATIIDGIRARESGRKAAKEGKGIGANPFEDETDELHWSWLDSWCVEKSAINGLKSFKE
jgi:hypothetical protein